MNEDSGSVWMMVTWVLRLAGRRPVEERADQRLARLHRSCSEALRARAKVQNTRPGLRRPLIHERGQGSGTVGSWSCALCHQEGTAVPLCRTGKLEHKVGRWGRRENGPK